jgi:predicted dehydrogenase
MLRVGLLGLGYWGPNYARVVRELPGAELTWACDVEPEKLELISRRDPGVRLTTRPEEVLGDPSVDALIVSTPTSTHTELSLTGLEAGKHVLCEKPLATSTADCDRLIAAAERSGRVLMVGHTFIFNPAVRRMRELVEAGEIGEILYCHASRTGLGPIREDTNALWDLAPHDISMILWITGKRPLEVSVTGESYLRPGYEDVAFMTIRLADRVLANVHVSWLDPYKIRNLTLIGDRRMVVFDDLSATEKLRLFDKGAGYEAAAREARGAEYGEYKAVVREGDITIPKLSAVEPLKEQLEHFLTCCLTGETPETDGQAGRDVVAVLEAASTSLRGREGAAGDLEAVPVA